MRYRDAPQVDLHPFHARRPVAGGIFRWLGYALVVAVFCAGRCTPAAHQYAVLGGLLVLSVLVWLVAWRMTVGAAWRTSLVAAALVAALHLAALRLSATHLAPLNISGATP